MYHTLSHYLNFERLLIARIGPSIQLTLTLNLALTLTLTLPPTLTLTLKA